MSHVTVDGLKVAYEHHGRTDGDALVLVAGFGMDIASWAEQLPAYAPWFRVYLLELRGIGGSDVPEPGYTTRDLARDVLALCDAEGLERIHFGGFSLGGAIGLEFAAAYPERLHSLSLHSTWEATEPYAHYKNWIEVRARIIAANDPVANTGTRIVSFFSPEFINNRQDRVQAFIEQARANPNPITPEGIAGHAHALLTHDVRERLDRVRCPTLITVGTHDRTTLPSCSRLLHKAIPGSELILIDGAGHCTLYEAPDELNSISLGFLIKHRRG
jgi:3-oxoadipate enol-lactonase